MAFLTLVTPPADGRIEAPTVLRPESDRMNEWTVLEILLGRLEAPELVRGVFRDLARLYGSELWQAVMDIAREDPDQGFAAWAREKGECGGTHVSERKGRRAGFRGWFCRTPLSDGTPCWKKFQMPSSPDEWGAANAEIYRLYLESAEAERVFHAAALWFNRDRLEALPPGPAQMLEDMRADIFRIWRLLGKRTPFIVQQTTARGCIYQVTRVEQWGEYGYVFGWPLWPGHPVCARDGIDPERGRPGVEAEIDSASAYQWRLIPPSLCPIRWEPEAKELAATTYQQALDRMFSRQLPKAASHRVSSRSSRV